MYQTPKTSLLNRFWHFWNHDGGGLGIGLLLVLALATLFPEIPNVTEYVLFTLPFEAGGHHDNTPGFGFAVSLKVLVVDFLFPFMFLSYGIELSQARLPGGELRGKFSLAGTLALCGVIVPGVIFTQFYMVNSPEPYRALWPMVVATDIVFSRMYAKWAFKSLKHPLAKLVLGISIIDDAIAACILAHHDRATIDFTFLLVGASIAMIIAFTFRNRGLSNPLWYLTVPGVILLFTAIKAGIEPAISMMPLVVMPGPRKDLGFFEEKELSQIDSQSRYQNLLENKLAGIILFLFAMVSMWGVSLRPIVEYFTETKIAFATIGSLVLGKTLGIPMAIPLYLMGHRIIRGSWPHLDLQARWIDYIKVGVACAVGCTMSLFFCKVLMYDTFPKEEYAAASLACVLSFAGAGLVLGAITIIDFLLQKLGILEPFQEIGAYRKKRSRQPRLNLHRIHRGEGAARYGDPIAFQAED